MYFLDLVIKPYSSTKYNYFLTYSSDNPYSFMLSIMILVLASLDLLLLTYIKNLYFVISLYYNLLIFNHPNTDERIAVP